MSAESTAPTIDPELAALESALGAQYEIVRLLGRGGMGVVYLARERLLDRLVAIKVLRDRNSDDSEERFLREARTAARLTHPNIVPLFSFGQAADTVFYVMGYVDGESLESLLKREGRLSPEEGSRILDELADALDYAHRNGVIHRDIKPDNVMIERGTGRAVLTDFGVAKIKTAVSLTATGVVVGTPNYMSPEQASGDRELDGRTDIYSLGVLGYRMIGGRLPFEANGYQEVVTAHMTRAPIPLQSVAPDASPGLTSAVMRCLAKAPEDRWQTGGQLRGVIGERTDSDAMLPDGLEHIPSLGVGVAVVIWAGDALALCVAAGTRNVFPLQFAGTASVLIPLVLLPSFVHGRKHGIPGRRILDMLFAPPARYGGWWPHRLRRQGDVWDRLPEVIRRARTYATVGNAMIFGSLPLALPYIIGNLLYPTPASDRMSLILALLGGVPLAVVLFGVRKLKAFAKANGLTRMSASRLLAEPTWGSRYWSRPDIAPLLGSAVRAQFGGPIPGSTAALLAEVQMLAGDLAVVDAGLAADVRGSARELGGLLERLDREVADVAANFDPAEATRLAERLDQLGSARADDGPAKMQMRRMLGEQLQLMRDLEQRRQLLESRREAGRERLRTLWLQLKGIRARQAVEAVDGAEITARIRALCAEITYATAARDEVDALTRN